MISPVSIFPHNKDDNKRIMAHLNVIYPFLNFTSLETLYIYIRSRPGLWLNMNVERALFDAS